MLYLLAGPDDYSIFRELARIKESAGDPAMLATNTSIFENGQVTPGDLQTACETAPFLADKRLVIVYDLLSKFTTKQTGGRISTKKNENVKNDVDKYAAILNNVPESSLVVLIEPELKENNPLYKLITPKAVVKTFPALKTMEIQQWVNQQVNNNGGSISPQANRLLSRLIGSNLWVMSNEISKLITYTDGRRIEENDVRILVGYTQQANVFAMVDAIIDFNLNQAQKLAQQLLDDGESPLGLLAMLNRQMRLIVRIQSLKKQNFADIEIKKKIGINTDFVFQKAMEQAKRYPWARLLETYELLLATDLALKTSKYEGDLALNIMISELCLQQSKSPSPVKSIPKVKR